MHNLIYIPTGFGGYKAVEKVHEGVLEQNLFEYHCRIEESNLFPYR
jgi:hypothetical protein